MAFVVDSSVTLAWVLGSQATATSRRISKRAGREAVHAPALWPLEFVNALWALERRRRLRAHQVAAAISGAERIGIVVHGEPVAFNVLLDLARQFEIAVYDAAYLELARRLALPIASLDAPQLAAARRAGIATV